MPEFLVRLDRISPGKLRTTNLLISLLILVPHLLVYFLAERDELGNGAGFWAAMAALDVLAIIVLLGCLATFRNSDRLHPVLKLQSMLLAIAAAGVFAWGLHLAIQGIPEGNFAFNPLFFVFLCAYPVYLLRRFVYPERLGESWFLNYSHVLAAGAALIVAVIIFMSFPPVLRAGGHQDSAYNYCDQRTDINITIAGKRGQCERSKRRRHTGEGFCRRNR